MLCFFRWGQCALRQTLGGLTLGSVVLVAACGSQKKGGDTGSTYVLNGDPMNLLNGTVADNRSPFTKTMLAALPSYFPAQHSQFVSRTSSQQSTKSSQDGRDTGLVYAFHDMGGGTWRLSAASGASFDFDEAEDGQLALRRYDGKDVTPVHYSISADQRVFSLLFKSQVGSADEALVYDTFVSGDDSAVPPPDMDSRFMSLLGAGKTVRWPTANIKTSLCGELSDELEAAMTQALNLWLENGKLGSSSLDVAAQKNCPPFSDVNHHGMTLVDDYVVYATADRAILGLTIPAIDKAQGLVAADTFVFTQSIHRLFGNDDGHKYLRATLTHEYGHFLGLGQVPATDADGNASPQSVMSDEQVLEPTAYDHEAIHALYH